MIATISLILGISIAILALTLVRRRAGQAGPLEAGPTGMGWSTLAFGLVALAAFVLALWLVPRTDAPGFLLSNLSIAFGFAAVIAGIGTLLNRDRRWPTWAGLLAGMVPVLFWVSFAAAHLFAPGE